MRRHLLAQLRIMLSRGLRREPYQDPHLVEGGPTLVIIPGRHPITDEVLTRPQRLFAVHIHRGAPDVQDPRVNSHSKLNCILAGIQANMAGADEALMLDPDGFVATCNALSGIRPVGEVDGRTIGSGQRGRLTEKLQDAYRELIERESDG